MNHGPLTTDNRSLITDHRLLMTILKTGLPTVGVGDDIEFTGGGTGCRFYSRSWLAGSAGISDFIAFLMLHKCYGFLTEDVKFIRTDFQHLFRTDLPALSATVTLIGVDSDVPVA